MLFCGQSALKKHLDHLNISTKESEQFYYSALQANFWVSIVMTIISVLLCQFVCTLGYKKIPVHLENTQIVF